MKREWPGSAQRICSLPLIKIAWRRRGHVLVIVRVVQAGPLLLLFVPPNQLLTVAPRLPIWARGGSIVNNAAVIGPCESPAVSEKVPRVAFMSAVSPLFRKDSAVNPRTASGGAVPFQIFYVPQLLPICNRIPIDFLQHFFGIGFCDGTLDVIVPRQSSESIIFGVEIVCSFRLWGQAQVIDEPQFTTRIAGSLCRFLSELQQALRVGESALFFGAASCWKEENFSADCLGREFASLPLG